MLIITTELLCKGCQCKLPANPNNLKDERPQWFSKWVGQEIVEWICVSCWLKNLRF